MDTSTPETPSASPSDPPREPRIRRRRPWLAGLLAACCPGLGLLYAGRLVPAFTIFWIPQLVLDLALAVATLANTAVVPVLLIGAALVLCVYAAQIVWATVAARRAGPNYPLKRWNHVLAYIGFAVLTAVTKLAIGGAATANVVELFTVPSGGMLPSIMIGDYLLVLKLGARNTTPRRGDIVVFRAPGREDTKYIQRVVALAGDAVSVRNGVLEVNGQPASRKAVGTQQFWERSQDTWVSVELQLFEEAIDNRRYLTALEVDRFEQGIALVRVPDDSFFTLGDKRNSSIDSRIFGPVPNKNLVGRADSLLFSLSRSGTLLDQVGLRL